MSIIDLMTSQIHAVVSPCWQLRDALADEVISSWDGPVKRVSDPEDLDAILVGLDTPSLFEPPSLWRITVHGKYVAKHKEALKGLAGQAVTGGVIVLVAESLPKNEIVGKAIHKAQAFHEAPLPKGKELRAWLTSQLVNHASEVERPKDVADALLLHRSDDFDGILSAIEQVALYVDEGPITVAAVNELIAGEAEQPIWNCTGAILEGRADQAIRLLYAGAGLAPEQVLAALIGEIRRCLASLLSRDDKEAMRMAGLPGRGNLYHARRRAQELGRKCLTRVLTGALKTQRDLRRTGTNGYLAIELLALNAQRVIRSVGG